MTAVTPARSALGYIEATEAVLAEINGAGDGRDFRIASGGGRMRITMDRYGADWPMVERGYRTHVFGEGRRWRRRPKRWKQCAARPTGAISTSASSSSNATLATCGEPAGTIVDGDAVIFFNFRGDRRSRSPRRSRTTTSIT